jgi:hypothetical protein
MTLQCLEIVRASEFSGERAAGCEVQFLCPRHGDHHPSLSINPEKNVWLCGPCGKSANAWELAAFISGMSPDNKLAVSSWLQRYGLLNGKRDREFVCAYVYRSEEGAPLFHVKRFKTPSGKTFAQERAEGSGWIGGEGCMRGVRLVPYRLPDWKDEKMLCIAEGEKDADNLCALGIPATCNPGGAGKWRTGYDPLFACKTVIMLPDNDEAGLRHADDIDHPLLPFAGAVKLLILPDLPPKGDVSDWISSGGSRDQFFQLIQHAPAHVPAISHVTRKENVVPLWPGLDPEALYCLPGQIVCAIDPFTEADPVSVRIHVLAAFRNVIGSSAHAGAVESDLHPARIFAVVIGEASKGRKGTSWSTPRDIFSRVDSKWLDERVRTGLSSGEGLIYHVRDEFKKTVPVKKGGRIIDYEEEIVDSGEPDKRLFCIVSEFSSMLKIMGREGHGLSGVIRQAWDSGHLSTLTRNNPLRATGAHVSIIGHTTRDELLRNLSATEQCNGFANRFLWLLANRSKTPPQGASLPYSHLSPEHIKSAIATLKSALTPKREKWERKPKVASLPPTYPQRGIER